MGEMLLQLTFYRWFRHLAHRHLKKGYSTIYGRTRIIWDCFCYETWNSAHRLRKLFRSYIHELAPPCTCFRHRGSGCVRPLRRHHQEKAIKSLLSKQGCFCRWRFGRCKRPGTSGRLWAWWNVTYNNAADKLHLLFQAPRLEVLWGCPETSFYERHRCVTASEDQYPDQIISKSGQEWLEWLFKVCRILGRTIWNMRRFSSTLFVYLIKQHVTRAHQSEFQDAIRS